MQEEIIEKYSKIKQKTVKHIKILLKDIDISKNKELEAEIGQLKNELKEIKKLKKYWLVWEEKQELFDKETIWKLPVLKEVKKNEYDNSCGRQTFRSISVHDTILRWLMKKSTNSSKMIL